MSVRKLIALVLILAIMVAGAYYLYTTEKADDDRMRNLYAEVEPIEREREELAAELKGLDVDYATKMRDYATVEILFTELDSQIISQAYPVMRDHGVVGVLCMNYTEFPTYYSKLKADEIIRLTNDGWGICILYDGVYGNFESWYTNFVRSLTSYQIPAPTSVYFPDNTLYDPEVMDEQFANCGVHTVILNATDGRSNTVTDASGDVWVTGAMPWNYTGSLADLELLGRTDGGNLAFTFKFTEIWDKTLNKNVESQEAKSFAQALDDWKDLLYTEDLLEDYDTIDPTPYLYVDTNDPDVLHDMYYEDLTPEQKLLLPLFRSVNFDAAYSYHHNAVEKNAELTREKELRAQELTSQIADLDAKIKSIYISYGVDVNSNKDKDSDNSRFKLIKQG